MLFIVIGSLVSRSIRVSPLVLKVLIVPFVIAILA